MKILSITICLSIKVTTNQKIDKYKYKNRGIRQFIIHNLMDVYGIPN